MWNSLFGENAPSNCGEGSTHWFVSGSYTAWSFNVRPLSVLTLRLSHTEYTAWNNIQLIIRVTDLSLLKQWAAEISQLEVRTEAPQYRLPAKWRLTCQGHSPSTELTPPTMRWGPDPTLFTGDGRPQAAENRVMNSVLVWFCWISST